MLVVFTRVIIRYLYKLPGVIMSDLALIPDKILLTRQLGGAYIFISGSPGIWGFFPIIFKQIPIFFPIALSPYIEICSDGDSYLSPENDSCKSVQRRFYTIIIDLPNNAKKFNSKIMRIFPTTFERIPTTRNRNMDGA